MADTGVDFGMTKEEDHTRERLGGLLRFYSSEADELFDHTGSIKKAV